MASFNDFSLSIAVTIHLGLGCFFLGIVLLRLLNYVEGFVLSTIFCILISFLVPAIQKARERGAQSLEYRSPNGEHPPGRAPIGFPVSRRGLASFM